MFLRAIGHFSPPERMGRQADHSGFAMSLQQPIKAWSTFTDRATRGAAAKCWPGIGWKVDLAPERAEDMARHHAELYRIVSNWLRGGQGMSEMLRTKTRHSLTPI